MDEIKLAQPHILQSKGRGHLQKISLCEISHREGGTGDGEGVSDPFTPFLSRGGLENE